MSVRACHTHLNERRDVVRVKLDQCQIGDVVNAAHIEAENDHDESQYTDVTREWHQCDAEQHEKRRNHENVVYFSSLNMILLVLLIILHIF